MSRLDDIQVESGTSRFPKQLTKETCAAKEKIAVGPRPILMVYVTTLTITDSL